MSSDDRERLAIDAGLRNDGGKSHLPNMEDLRMIKGKPAEQGNAKVDVAAVEP